MAFPIPTIRASRGKRRHRPLPQSTTRTLRELQKARIRIAQERDLNHDRYGQMGTLTEKQIVAIERKNDRLVENDKRIKEAIRRLGFKP